MLMLSTYAATLSTAQAQTDGRNRQLHARQVSPDQKPAQQSLARQQTVFVENKGQWDSRAKFLLRSPGMDLWITDNGVVYDINRVEPIDNNSILGGPRVLGATDNASATPQQPPFKVTSTPVFITYEGASREASAIGTGQLPHYHNYYIGNDRTTWASHVPLYSDARVRGLYNGVDVVFYLDNGRPRYDLVISPGADPAKIRMKIDGATNVSVASNGALRIATSLGVVEQRELFAYQEVNGAKRKVQCGFVIDGDGRVGFGTGSYDRSRPLVIDPLVYSTYLGGSGDEMYGGSFSGVEGSARTSGGIAVDGDGNAYIVGTTSSSSFPTQNASDGSRSAVYNAFVTKLTSSGAISYSTYLGGSDQNNGDQGVSIAVDGSSNAYVTGWTFSTDFPTLNAFQSSKSGGMDVFVTKLTSSGSLSFSSFLGGSFNDRAYGIAVDGSGNIHVTGFTGSGSFPGTSGAGTSGFMTKISGGSISFSRYLVNQGRGIAVDGSGNIYVAGTTNTSGTSQDVFATKFTSSGSVSYSVTFGGSGGSALDVADGIAVDGSGNAYITGYTNSSNFPTQNAAQSTHGGDADAFVTKLTSSGSISYSTYLGTSSQEFANGIAVDANGNAYIAGVAGPGSSSLTTSDAVQRNAPGASEGFVARLISSGAVSYYTLLGGSEHDHCEAIAIDGGGNVYVTGYTNSNNFPTQNAAQGSRAGANDAFVTKLTISSITSVSLATSGPYCSGSTVSVGWQSSGVSSVDIAFSTNDGSTWSSLATSQSSGTSGGSYAWTVPNSPGTGRKIHVSASGNSSVSAVSSSFAILSSPVVTDDPDNVSTTALTSGGATFSASASGSTPLAFQWQVSTNGGSSWSNVTGETSDEYAIDAGDLVAALSGNKYRVTVTNSCSSVNSLPATLTVAKASASVSLADLSHTYDGSAKAASASTSPSGLSVTITYAQDASPVSSPTNAGSYDVTATINDGNYQGTTTGTMVIGKATLTVTADDQQKSYGDDNPTLTASYSGFVNNEDASVLSGVPGLATSADPASGVGDYAITSAQGTLTADNYQFSFQDGTLSIVPASLTVTADNKTKTYGDDNPSFTASYDGFVNGDDQTDLSGTLAFSTDATAASGAGVYDISPSGLTSDNYDITFVDGELNVTRAELEVTADNKTRVYGLTNPTLTASYSGFINGDDESVLSGSPSLSTTATAASDVGDFTITIGEGDLDADNYSFSFVNGALTVTAATLTVTADDKEKTCGQSNPTLTGMIDGIRNGDEITASYSTSATSSSGAGDFAIIPSASGSALANYDVTYVNGLLTVNPPTISTHPSDQVVASGATATFTVAPGGSETIQWQVSTDGGTTWNDITGATSTTLSFTASATLSGNQYRAVIDNGTCTNATFPATLSVKVIATDFGPAVMFLGVVNNQDNNRHIDLRVELYKNSDLISSGEVIDDKVTGPNQNGSRKYTVPLTMANGAVDFDADDQLSVKVYARRNGGSSDFPVLLWHNDSPLPNVNHGNKGWARVGTETVGGTNTGYFYLLDDQELSTSSGSSGESIQKTLGTSWVLYDTWTMYGASMKPTVGVAVTGELTMEIVPNPTTGTSATLRLSTRIDAEVVVTLFNSLGQHVRRWSDVPVGAAGAAAIPIDLIDLPAGTYTVQVSCGDNETHGRLTIVR